MKELWYALGGIGLALTLFYFIIIADMKPKVEYCYKTDFYGNHKAMRREDCKPEELRISMNKKLRGERVVARKVKVVEEKPDLFKMVRQTWQGCGACHGQKGEGGVGPKLAGQTADYIATALTQYKNKQKRGRKSQMMYGQASALSTRQIDMIAELVQAELK